VHDLCRRFSGFSDIPVNCRRACSGTVYHGGLWQKSQNMAYAFAAGSMSCVSDCLKRVLIAVPTCHARALVRLGKRCDFKTA